MNNLEKVFLGGVTGSLLLILYFGYSHNAWAEAVQTGSILIAAAVLVDSAITRRESRRALDATLEDSRKIQESSDRPLVVFEATRQGQMAYLTFSNQGTAPASRVRVHMDEHAGSHVFGDVWSIPMLSEGIAFISVGQSISIPFDRLGGAQPQEPDWWKVIRGSVTYAHALDESRRFTSPVALDLRRFKGTHISGDENPDIRSAKHLEQIAKTLDDIRRRK